MVVASTARGLGCSCGARGFVGVENLLRCVLRANGFRIVLAEMMWTETHEPKPIIPAFRGAMLPAEEAAAERGPR